MIVLHTNYGEISIELDFENTPNTANNFFEAAKNGFYDNLIFHRVIKGFMIQGGGFDSKMQHKEAPSTIENEAEKSLPNKCYTVAMARTSDPHSASTQFFINTADNDFLNFKTKSASGWGYCVFGKVIAGMNVVDKINAVATTSRSGHQDVPVDPVVIEKVTITEQKETESNPT